MSSQRLRGGLLLAVCLLPVFLSANFVWRFGVDVPFWDEWELVPLLRALHDGQLSFAALVAQHNEHRLLFPRVVMLALAVLTRWDARAEMWFGWVLLCGMGLVLFFQHGRALGAGARSAWLFAPVPWLVFTLRQSENLIWGWQLQIFMAALAMLFSMAALEHERWGWFLVAICTAVVSSFSFAAGLATWPAGLLVIGLAGLRSRPQRVRLGAWAIGGLIVVALYLHDFQRPAHHPDPAFAARHLAQASEFFIAMLGASLAGQDVMLALAIGLLLVAIFVLVIRAVPLRLADLSRLRFGLALGLFAACTCAMVTVGRVGFDEGPEGIGLAITSRYTTFTMLGVCGAYLCVLAIRPSALRSGLLGALLVLLMIGTTVSLGTEFRSGARTRRTRLAGLQALLHYREADPAELMKLYPDAALVRARAAEIEALQTSVFRASARAPRH
ncbi:MAG TPA: hypothetical protein VMT11_17330 [Myxococcaceae bacterium]|nr:hypothetical protein [Myxococcaceae bacterium]